MLYPCQHPRPINPDSSQRAIRCQSDVAGLDDRQDSKSADFQSLVVWAYRESQRIGHRRGETGVAISLVAADVVRILMSYKLRSFDESQGKNDRSYVRGMINRCFRTQYRRPSRERTGHETQLELKPDQSVNPIDSMIQKEQAARLHQHINALSPPDQFVVVSMMDEVPVADQAKRLRTSKNGILVRRHRALRKLKESLLDEQASLLK
jgi:RNA polymerase sigma factor (sigma-70 family)